MLSVSRRLYLFTPVPPVRSGTADYADTLLQHLPASITRRFQVCFVCEPQQFDAMPREHRGVPVLDYRTVAPRAEDVCLYFIANNEFHRYALALLSRHRFGLPVTMIHDLQCLMNVSALCYLGEYGFTRADLGKHLETELGDKAERFAEAVWASTLPQLFVYLALAQSIPLRRSAAILVHSYYARARLLLETRPEIPVPPLWVVQHPSDEGQEAINTPRTPRSAERFLVSTFGWVAPSKRTIPIIEGFARFRAHLPVVEQAEVELRIVGQLPPVESYDPVTAARQMGVDGGVRFFGYVSLLEMQRLMSESHLVFNLRFPSCGETSGTLRRCRDLGVPVATTAYAAFHEEHADFRVSADPQRESADIEAALLSAYRHFRAHASTEGLIQLEQGMLKLGFWDALLRATEAVSKERAA